jgi:hypothetical protein
MEYAGELVTLAEVVLAARKETNEKSSGRVRLGKEGEASSILPSCRIRWIFWMLTGALVLSKVTSTDTI